LLESHPRTTDESKGLLLTGNGGHKVSKPGGMSHGDVGKRRRGSHSGRKQNGKKLGRAYVSLPRGGKKGDKWTPGLRKTAKVGCNNRRGGGRGARDKEDGGTSLDSD